MNIRLLLNGFPARIALIKKHKPVDVFGKPLLPRILKQCATVERCRVGVNEKRRGYGVRHLERACDDLNQLLCSAEFEISTDDGRHS